MSQGVKSHAMKKLRKEEIKTSGDIENPHRRAYKSISAKQVKK